MSVLNQSGEEQIECPLCMESLEVDDLNFYPCTCGYQICRFCWHRIRTDENGLCPACRKAYSENPADFTPLSKEQVAQLKAEKRQRDQQRKAKLSESRKHLASVRVVQRNLVFVVGLPMRLADADILKKHEYFGKFGKIHKVVINQSTSYAGSQGPSASAYVTYVKSDDALRAIQSVNNIMLDGRPVKSSLGTTKYCSHFMKNQPCPKSDCMYLHDFGDAEASFTKEEMHAGKHQEYEKKLHEALLSRMAAQSKQEPAECTTTSTATTTTSKQPTAKTKEQSSSSTTSTGNASKETWPQLNNDGKSEKAEKKAEKEKRGKRGSKNGNGGSGDGKKAERKNCDIQQNQSHGNGRAHTSCSDTVRQEKSSVNGNGSNHMKERTSPSPNSKSNREHRKDSESSTETLPKIQMLEDNTSFFSQNAFHKIVPDQEHDPAENQNGEEISALDNSHGSHILNDSLPDINSCEDWEAAFGFTKHLDQIEDVTQQRNTMNDTLETFGNGYNPINLFLNRPGFDKFVESTSYNYLNNCYDVKSACLIEKTARNNASQFAQSLIYKGQLDTSLEDRLHVQYSMSNHVKDLNGGIGAINGVNGVDQMSFPDYCKSNGGGQKEHMSFSDFCKNNSAQKDHVSFTDFCKNNGGQKDLVNGYGTTTTNGLTHQFGLNGLSQSINNSLIHSLTDKRAYLYQQQKQVEEQLMMLSLKPHNQQQFLQQNGQFLNGELHGQVLGPLQSQLYQNSSMGVVKHSLRNTPEAELDFDPFQETQKALAEMISDEPNVKNHAKGHGNTSTSQINGLIHNQNNHIPPPPPGFVQPHMNSFGSKILPFLNMNSQQQINGTSNNYQNWPNYNSIAQQQQQHKAMGSSCNDWKVLDPAIVSSSRYFSIANVPPLREQYNPLSQLANNTQQQQQNGIRNSYEFTSNGTFSNLSQIQPGYSFPHVNSQQQPQQNLHWLVNGDMNTTQISSPPGFRSTGQATKQQEC